MLNVASTIDLIQDILSVGESPERRFAAVDRYGKNLGFDYVAYGCSVPFPQSPYKIREMNSYPRGWVERYEAQKYIDKDPLVDYALKQDAPLVWSTEHSTPLFQSAERLRREACDEGLRFGWTQGTVGHFGVRSYLTLARKRQAIEAHEVVRLGPSLEQLRRLSHICLYDLIKAKELTLSTLPKTLELTAQELKILSLMAEGSSASEAAISCQRSIDTINFHMRNILRKLECNNKTVAVVKALRLGLL